MQRKFKFYKNNLIEFSSVEDFEYYTQHALEFANKQQRPYANTPI